GWLKIGLIRNLDSRPAPDTPGRGCAGERAPKIAFAARARIPPEPQRCHSGLQLHHRDCRRRVAPTAESRCAATPMIGIWWKPSLKWPSAKFRALLAGLTAAPETRPAPGVSGPNR